ncbi:YdcF family protein [Bacillus songklensis]|uniref:YdcF family protein n=1 Tax=Bacillus songklensis TaxID=1069116 RepID=A0ABV8B3I2_9BACI
MFKKILLIITIGVLFTVTIMLKVAGDFLVMDEKPVKSDVIIVLSGGGIERLEKGVELYKKGFAPYFMISNGQEDGLYEAAQKMGVPIDSIILENNASSTTENALFTKKLMMKHKFQSALVVSSNYHMRRVKTNYSKAIKNTGIKLVYCSDDSDEYDPGRWWATKEGRQTTYIEYIKLVGNFFGFHGNDAKKELKNMFSFH